MSSAVSAHPPGGLHPQPELKSVKDQQNARSFGLTSATGLVIGTVIGAGVSPTPGARHPARPETYPPRVVPSCACVRPPREPPGCTPTLPQ